MHFCAVGQHKIRLQHVVYRTAVFHTARAACVLGQVAAQRADALAGGVRRVEKAQRGQPVLQVTRNHARLYQRIAFLRVDL